MRYLVFVSMVITGLFAKPYLYLSSRMFPPGEAVSVRLETEGIDVLNLRLYRIDKPIDFFKKQSDPHSITTANTKQVTNSFNILKEIIQRPAKDSRYLMREILTEPSRIALRDYLGIETVAEKPAPPPKGSVPVLRDFPLVREEKFLIPVEGNEHYRSYYGDVPLGSLEPGVYLLEAYYGLRVAYAPIIVTNLGIITKQSPKDFLVFTCERERGAPKANSEVVVVSDTTVVKSGTSNRDGIFLTRIDTTGILVLAKNGKDFAISESYFYGETDAHYKVYLYTERPIYRPAQVVYFKGIVREFDRGDYKTLGDKKISLEVSDPDGNKIYEQELVTNKFGSLSDSLLLSDKAKLGRYTLSTRINNSYHSVQFQVEEYRKPEYKVEVNTDKPAYVQGEKIGIDVTADYFFGAPVVDGDVKLVIYRARYTGWWEYGYELLEELTETTDAKGKARFDYQLPAADESYSYKFEAQVRDKARHEETGITQARAFSAMVVVNVQTNQYVLKPSERIVFQLKTVDILNQPTASPVEIKVFHQNQEVFSTHTYTDTYGRGKLDYQPTEEGDYKVIASVTDDKGNSARSQDWFWVTKGEYFSYEANELEIIASKKEYAAGEVASFLVISPNENSFLLATIEGIGIYYNQTVELKGNTALIQIPIKKDYAPNFYFSICQLVGENFDEKTEGIKVSTKDRLLKIVLSADKGKYKPGERGTINVEVRDANNRPVECEFSLGIVDEAIYSLASEIALPIDQFFYGAEDHLVSTSSSAYFSFWGYERGYRDLAQAAKDKEVVAAYKGREEPAVREKFKDTAFWLALVTTDRRGKARVEFDYPDNLTTWRTTVKAFTTQTLVGEKTFTTLVKKDLLVRLIPPRFFTERDSLVITTVAHNYLDQAQHIKLGLNVKGIELLTAPVIEADLPVGGSYRMDWPVRATDAGPVELLAQVLSPQASDAVKLTLPSAPHGLERTLNIGGSMRQDYQSDSKDFTVPPEAAKKNIRSAITITPTYSTGIFAGLKYLAGYPYGCVEQTMSSFLPDLVVAKLLKDPKRGDPELAKTLPAMIARGLARLYNYQHGDGGWGWWEHDDTDPFMTAYALYGLFLAKEAGYAVNPSVLDQGTNSLIQQLGQADLEPVTRTFMLYTLSFSKKDLNPILETVLPQLNAGKLNPYGQALMVLTLYRLGKKAEAQSYLAGLKNSAKIMGEMCYWEGKTPHSWYDDATEITATALRALLAVEPKSDLVFKATYWLLKHRQGSSWKSSKDTALALLALAEFLSRYPDREPNFQLTLLVNGQKIKEWNINKQNLNQFNRPLELGTGTLKIGANRVEITKKGKGFLFYSLVVNYYSQEENIRAGGNRLRISREYFQLAPRESADRIVYEKIPFSGVARVGEPILVKLTIDTEDDAQYVMVEDPLPAGVEVVKNTDSYVIPGERGYEGYRWWSWWWADQEVHDDRIAFFISHLWSGHRTLSYIVKPFLPGTYHAMPASLSLMYFPDERANSKEEKVTVKE
jgi:uncharacterized protein YfaS (alpha-2-macroglobulin family)